MAGAVIVDTPPKPGQYDPNTCIQAITGLIKAIQGNTIAIDCCTPGI